MSQTGQRIDLDWGYILFDKNELSIISTVEDPPKLRLGAMAGGSLGCVTGNIVGPDGRQEEVALFQFKKDERTRGRADLPYGEMTLHIKGPALFAGHDGMLPVMTLLHDYVWLKGVNGAAPSPPVLNLPPVITPPPPPPDEWLSTANQEKHQRECDRIEAEMGFPMDEGRRRAYMEGRNRNLTEVHDDELNRAGFPIDPCNGVNKIPL